MSPGPASPDVQPAAPDQDLREGREVTIASPGSPFDQLRGRVEIVTDYGLVFVSVPGKGFLQLHPEEIALAG